MAQQIVRGVLIAGGVIACAYGISLMWEFSTADQVSIVVWLALGLALHDAVLAPLTLAVSWLLRRWLPPWWSRSVLVALALTNVVVLLALPVILPRTADDGPANSSVLDRDYRLGLTVAIVLIWVVTAVVALALRARVASRESAVNRSTRTPPPQ